MADIEPPGPLLPPEQGTLLALLAAVVFSFREISVSISGSTCGREWRLRPEVPEKSVHVTAAMND